MKHYTYICQNHNLPFTTYHWFERIKVQQWLRQAERNNPGKVAVLYAELHLAKVQS